MFSYIFMKILESRPERYDSGINILSGGHARKIKEAIVKSWVRPGMSQLDIGCGTGELLLKAARKGARVTGVDISEGMLSIARKRIAGSGLSGEITLHEAGATEVGALFSDNSFDLITSTLVFSELYAEERSLLLSEIRRLLKPGGRLVIAVEVVPTGIFQRIIHFLIRLPLTVLTYIIAQTGTKPMARISEEINLAGMKVESKELSFLGSFALISAVKSAGCANGAAALPVGKNPRDDVSLLKTIWDFTGRWFPNPVEPGLRVIGQPDENSPVLVTSNFHLTVRRVERALRGENVHLLVVPANGINVWCGACGGDLSTHSIITALKTSRMGERVKHRRLILPQFSAPGIDRALLRRRTGWHSVFGPAYAKDIPAYLKTRKITAANNRAKFPLPFRMEMLFSMNFLVWALLAVAMSFVAPARIFAATAMFWGAGLVLYAGYPLLPTKSGWMKAVLLSLMEILAIALISVFALKQPWHAHWGWMVTAFGLTLWLGFDLKGIVAGDTSEAEWLMHKLGVKSMGHLFSAEAKETGIITQDLDKCTNCEICILVCPKGVFGFAGKKKVVIQNRGACFACNACVRQCPDDALAFT